VSSSGDEGSSPGERGGGLTHHTLGAGPPALAAAVLFLPLADVCLVECAALGAHFWNEGSLAIAPMEDGHWRMVIHNVCVLTWRTLVHASSWTPHGQQLQIATGACNVTPEH
jgi:hypothetical protein